jgi:1,4-alpha-glucan branching enzyme
VIANAPELERIVKREHGDPHSVLGAHQYNGGVVVRALRPAAQAVKVHAAGKDVQLEQVHPGGVFEGVVPDAKVPLEYQLEIDYPDGNVFTVRDPYSFAPTFGELDLHLAGEGRHERLYERLGAHIIEHEGASGTAFAVWAPSAKAVSVVGDFNSWDGRLHQMRSLGSTGIWELFLPDVGEGCNYKFEILTQDGEVRLKADPYAFRAEHPPKTASVVHRSSHEWNDDDWCAHRGDTVPLDRPVSIYEVHLGSWRLNPLEDNRSLGYLELAEELGAYAKDMGFTHI